MAQHNDSRVKCFWLWIWKSQSASCYITMYASNLMIKMRIDVNHSKRKSNATTNSVFGSKVEQNSELTRHDRKCKWYIIEGILWQTTEILWVQRQLTPRHKVRHNDNRIMSFQLPILKTSKYYCYESLRPHVWHKVRCSQFQWHTFFLAILKIQKSIGSMHFDNSNYYMNINHNPTFSPFS